MIDKENFEKASFEENQKFIKEILRLTTHNAFTKEDLLLLIKWQNAIIEKMMCCANCKYKQCGMKEIFKAIKDEDETKICEEWELAE
jgi:cytochrome b subunit of formate dehydrogenase